MNKKIQEHVDYMTERLLTDDQTEYETQNNHNDVDFDADFFKTGKAAELEFTEEDADADELQLGIETEMEHTNNEEIAKKIALDHLAEISDYYTRLKVMEEDAKSENKDLEGSEDNSEDNVEDEPEANPEDSEDENPEEEPKKKFNFENLQIQKDLEFVNEVKYIDVITKSIKEAKNYKSFLVDVDVKNKKFKTVYGCKETEPTGKSGFEKLV